MQPIFSASATLFVLLLGYGLGSAQENVTIVAPASEAAEGLNLRAVGELFKDSENLQAFARALNSSGVGVNNLDLDGDGKVDFIRVVEAVTDDAHLIVLQVPLGEDEFQDVATIEVEKTADDAHNMQVRGNEVIYGVHYYVAPAPVHIHTWPIVSWMYRLTLPPPLQVGFLFQALSPLVEAASTGDIECLSNPHGQVHKKKHLHGYPNQQSQHGK